MSSMQVVADCTISVNANFLSPDNLSHLSANSEVVPNGFIFGIVGTDNGGSSSTNSPASIGMTTFNRCFNTYVEVKELPFSDHA